MSSDLKVTNIKHESSSSNNLVLASDGSATATLSSTSVIPASVGGVMVFLEKFTASSTASKVFDLTAFTSYNNYVFKLNAILSATDNVNLKVHVGTSSADADMFDTSQTYRLAQGHSFYDGNSSGGGNDQISNDTFIKLNLLGNNSGYGTSGTINLFSPRNSSINTSAKAEIVTQNANEYTQSRNLGTYRTGASNDAYIKFFFSSGNIASGTITLYGIKDA